MKDLILGKKAITVSIILAQFKGVSKEFKVGEKCKLKTRQATELQKTKENWVLQVEDESGFNKRQVKYKNTDEFMADWTILSLISTSQF